MSKKYQLTDLEETVLVTVRWEGCVKRAEIASRLCLTEREVRRAIASLNEKGYAVVSSGEGFIYATGADDLVDVKVAVRKLKAQAKSIMRRARPLERFIRQYEQPAIPGLIPSA